MCGTCALPYSRCAGRPGGGAGCGTTGVPCVLSACLTVTGFVAVLGNHPAGLYSNGGVGGAGGVRGGARWTHRRHRQQQDERRAERERRGASTEGVSTCLVSWVHDCASASWRHATSVLPTRLHSCPLRWRRPQACSTPAYILQGTRHAEFIAIDSLLAEAGGDPAAARFHE